MCLFLRIFGHHGISQDVQRIIIGNMMILTKYTRVDVFRRLPIKITRVIGGPTQQCQCWTSYCPYKMRMTDYVIVRDSGIHSKYIKTEYWETVYHHECYKKYLNHWISISL